jgi:hypothetical protein
MEQLSGEVRVVSRRMSLFVTPELFGDWPLDQQLAHLDATVCAGSMEGLWQLCACSLDSKPVVHLCALAVERRLAISGGWLLELRPSTLAAVLALEGLGAAVEEAWRRAGLADLVSFCLLDRYLRRHAATLWEALVRGVEEQAAERLGQRRACEPELLLRLQGAQQRSLARRFPQAWEGWTPEWREAARSGIRLLAERPRDVSQANAERLLSQQVYTDPGHFLLELLQNADDAGARNFSVEFGSDALIVRHDGEPFDFRDLVGVLSIGQTTKKSTQIGYFGVGFKSVYEVTDRPRLHSGHFSFEIADISVPRPIAPPSMAWRWGNDETVLVLPLKAGLEPGLYWRKALEIEPAILLNVPNLRRIVWQGEEEVSISLSASEGDVMVLRHAGQQSRYLLCSGSYRHSGPRPPGKPARATVRLALPVDGKAPATNLYSFLPINERSGLSFIVGSHFDVPVDRERLDPGSAWNQGVVASIAGILAEHFGEHPEQAWRLLPLMPLPEDPLALLFQAVPSQLAARIRHLPVLPGGRKGEDVALLDADLLPLFELHREPALLCPQEPRLRRWVELLGASSYSLETLLEALSEGRLPGRLEAREPKDWSALHGLLMATPAERLANLPIFLDDQGQPLTAREAMVLEPSWRELFETAPRSLSAELSERPETAALLARLDVPSFGWESMLAWLRGQSLSNLRPEVLYDRLAEAPRAIILACLELPLFADRQGRLGPLVPAGAMHLGVVAPSADLPEDLLPQARLLASTPALERLLQGLRWPRFDLAALVDALEWHSLSPAQADRLLLAVEGSGGDWTGTSVEKLCGLSIFESAAGERLPLSRLWRYEEEGLQALLPDRPPLAPGSVSQRVVDKLGLGHRLSRADLDLLLEHLPGSDPGFALRFLSERAQRLTRSQIEKLLRLPVFEGRPLIWPDQDAGRGLMAARPAYAELFVALGRRVLRRETTELVMPLLVASAYPLLGLPQLVESLAVAAPTPELLPRLHELFAVEAAGLQLAFSEETRQALPIWLARSGQVISGMDLPPSPELASLTGRGDWLLAQPPAPELADLFPTLEPDAYLRRLLALQARMGGPLAEQPAWCGSIAAVDTVSSHLPLSYLMVDAEGRLRDSVLHHASTLAYPWLLRSPLASELIHPQSSPEQKHDCAPLDAALILETYYPLRNEPAMRQSFYTYLQAELGTVASDPEARAFLLEVAMWRSAGGRWKSLDELILDPEIPDLGSDWNPHPEIPSKLLQALETVLGVGRPDPLALLADHLLPAYLDRPASRASILEVMARLSRGLETSTLRRNLRGADGAGSFPLPVGGDLRDGYRPPEELEGLPHLRPVTAEPLAFLRRLGLRYLPGPGALRAARLAFEDGEALLRLVEWAWQQRPEELEPLWEALGELAWVPARDRSLKLPRQLFLRSAEIEELIGSAPEQFVSRRLPVGLARKLGLKQEGELDALLVVRHLRSQAGAGARVAPALYQFLETSLGEGRVSPHYLAEALKDVPWVWSDEGEYRLARHVLAVPAFRYFGAFRGTWEGAYERYPRLATLFGIATAVTPEMVLEFLQEVHQQPAGEVTRRLLRTCLALLGEGEAVLPRNWRVIPASLAGSGQPLVVCAAETGLVRSNSPTLTALFARAGRLLVADAGDAETGPSLERLYQRLGIPRLRDAYTVRPDRSSREVSGEVGDAVAHFRSLLRALSAVLPRLRAARPEWEEGEWLAESRLRHFMTTGPIRVLQDLRLSYHLPGVATVAVEAAAAFDPDGQELLVGAAALTRPGAHAVSLAEGLLELLYQGPGSEGLVDLLNLLIPLGQREAMEAYLDRRHFPRPGAGDSGMDRLGERVGEILDYGLHKILERRFSELSGSDWSRWRRSELNLPEVPPAAAGALLAMLECAERSAELLQTLTDMLAAADLEDLTAQLWESGSAPAVVACQPLPPRSPAGLAPGPALAAREAPAEMAPATAGSGLSGMGQKMLGRLGQLLGMPATPSAVLGFQRELPDVAETYRHPPERHLLVSTRALQGHDLYCLSMLGVDFDARRQVYVPGPVPWNEPFESSGRRVEISGRLTLPDYPLPKPLFSKLVGPPVVRGSRGTLRGPDGAGLYRLAVEQPEAEIAYTVELSLAPDLEAGVPLDEPDPRFLKPTAALAALPPLLLEWISWARSSGLPQWQLAQRARDFVAAHYRYDVKFMETEELKELAQRPYRPDENRMLSLLHAGARGNSLGTGVCLELSAILVEMLRRARIPAVLASAWMLDQGLIHHPDHAIAMALLPSAQGPVWIPLEPSVNRMVQTGVAGEPEVTRAALLQGASDLVLGASFAAPSNAREREKAQEEALLRALGDRRRLEALLECIARSGRYLRDIDSELQWLAAKGYLTVVKEELYRVSPKSRRPGSGP